MSRRLMGLIICIFLAAVCLPIAHAVDSCSVLKSGSEIYKNRALTSGMTTVKKMTLVKVKSIKDDVAKITINNTTRYTKSENVTTFNVISKASFSKDSNVYETPSLNARTVKVNKGLCVNVLWKSGTWVLIERNGVLAYTKYRWLTVPKETQDDEYAVETEKNVETVEEEKSEASEEKDKVVQECDIDAVTTENCDVYEEADTSSKRLGTLSRGIEVHVSAVRGGWAYITYKGKSGFAAIASLKAIDSAQEGVADAEEPAEETNKESSADSQNKESVSSSEIFSSSKSTDEKLYLYFTKVAGLSPAAACGIVANIDAESSFRTSITSSDGGYGLCQWMNGRLENLLKYLSDNGYSKSSLEGQAKFIIYEMKNKYSSVYSYINNVPNTEQGAYDAAYQICYYYEIPANRDSNGIKRGNLASDKYWSKFVK